MINYSPVGKKDPMYPMLLLCCHRFLRPERAGRGVVRGRERVTVPRNVPCACWFKVRAHVCACHSPFRDVTSSGPGALVLSSAHISTMSMSTLSIPRIVDVTEVLYRNFTLDTAKNCFLVYFFARRALKLWRHIRARGLGQSFGDLYRFIVQVFIVLPSPFVD